MNDKISPIVFGLVCKGAGINLTKELVNLSESQYWNSQKLYIYQGEMLKKHIEFACNYSPYYAKTLTRYGKIEALEKLTELPITTKRQVQQNYDDIFVEKPDIRYISGSTSGSTGTPLEYRINKDAHAKHFAAEWRALMWHDVNFYDRQALLWGLTLDTKKRIYWHMRDFLLNRIRFVAYESNPEKLFSFYNKCCKFRPRYISGYASSVHRFSLFINQNSLETSGWGTKVVMPTAEVLYPHQRADIENAFHCNILNEYGCSEVPGIAYECEFGNLHLTHENIIFELLDDNGNPIPYKEQKAGRITLTPIYYRSMPLVRYQNGDLATWSGVDSCPCGRQPGIPTLKEIAGRSVDILVDELGNESNWTAIYYSVKKIFEHDVVDEFQVIQKTLNRIHFKIVPGCNFKEDAMLKVEERVRSILGNTVNITYELMDYIPRTETGKFKYFVSELTNCSYPRCQGQTVNRDQV